MTGRRLRALAAVAALAAAASSCDPTFVQTHVQSVVFDLSAHKFTCLREFTCEVAGSHVTYVERVRSAGDGKNVVVELYSLNGKRRSEITDPDQRRAFDRLSAMLTAGAGQRALFQRDPRIDSIDRLAANYVVTPIELRREALRPGGEPTITCKVEPRVADRPFYVLTVSAAASHEGFPVECQEYVYGVNGPQLVSSMKVIGPLLWDDSGGDVNPKESPIVSRTAVSLDDARVHAAEHGLTLLLPQDGSLPSGFELATAEEVVMNSSANAQRRVEEVTLFRFVYSDGLERIDFVEHAPVDSVPPLFRGQGANDLATLATFGPISTATLVHQGTQIAIESRVASDRFHALMKSLVELK